MVSILLTATVALFLRFFLTNLLAQDNPALVIPVSLLIISVGGFFVLYRMARLIENTTEELSKRTGLAGGFLQSLGTAFPDMVIGIVAALSSLSLMNSDYAQAINFALIAAATTFGSNIYNIGYATWCVFRQNRANSTNKTINMIPWLPKAGQVKPVSEHKTKPAKLELNNAIDVINALSLLTAFTAITMVIFGRVANPPAGITGDLFQLIKPAALVLMLLTLFILFKYRKGSKKANLENDKLEAPNPYHKMKTSRIWLDLALSGAVILFAAESMVTAIERFCEVTQMPFIVAGVLAGMIGCLGEILVVHSYSVNPKGRIGDAIVGVGMDNIVTILGATIVALIGGIFLGGTSMILIFVIIFALNTMLMWQVSKFKDAIPG